MAAGRARWRPALGGLLLCLAVGLVIVPAPSPALATESLPGFDCAQLDDQAPPETPLAWFERSLWANHCYVFQARAVRISVDGVRTVALTHDVKDGVEREAARFLDGLPVVFERRGRIGRLTWTDTAQEAPPSPAGIARHLERFYRLSLGPEERIANRRAVLLDIEPLDSLRYGHRLWLDAQTGLPLKQQLLDEEGRVVETFQLTELQSPRLYAGSVLVDAQRPPPTWPWAPGWLPAGFLAQPVATGSREHEPRIAHRVFSDGLSTLSLFVEPLELGHAPLMPGLHRLGVSLAVVRHLSVAGRPVQVVAMGELPPRVLVRVVESLQWSDEATP